MADAVIGALRVVLGADTATFEDGLKKGQSALGTFAKNVGTIAAGIGLERIIEKSVELAVGAVVDGFERIDQVGKEAQKAGIGVEVLSGLQLAAELSDVSLQQLAGSLEKLSKNMVQAAAGTGEAQKTFEALGISVTESSGKLKSADVVLTELAGKFGNSADGAAKTAAAIALLGKAGAELIPLLNTGAAGLEEMRKTAEQMGLVIDKNTANAVEKFNDNLKILGKTQEGIANLVIQAIIPALVRLSDQFVEVAKQGGIQQTVAALIIKEFRGIVVAVFEVVAAFQGLGEAFSAIKAFFEAGDMENTQAAWDKFAGVLGGFAERLRKARDEANGLFTAITVGGNAALNSVGTPGTNKLADAIASLTLKTAEARGEFSMFATGFATQAAALGLTDKAAQGLSHTIEGLTPQQAQLNAAMLLFQGAKMANDALNPWERLQKQIEMTNVVIANGAVTSDEANKIQRKLIEDTTKFYANSATTTAKGWSDAFAIMAKENKQFAGVAKGLAITMAIINTYQAATKALAEIPYPFSLVAAAGAIAFGFAQVRQIQAQTFARGGSFRVGGGLTGMDSEMVSFRATPGEMVDIRRPGQTGWQRWRHDGQSQRAEPRRLLWHACARAGDCFEPGGAGRLYLEGGPMIITQDGYTPGDDPAGVPLIGYANDIAAITASSAATGFPAANLLNPATHLVWKGSAAQAETLSGLPASGQANFFAIAKHNFFDAGIRVALASSQNADAATGQLSLLFHFDGTNGTSQYYDSSGNDVALTSVNSALLSTAQFKFGTASLALGGTAYARAAGSLFSFAAAVNFTLDFWVRITATGTLYTLFDSNGTTTGFRITKDASDHLIFTTGNVARITGATALTTGTWHHVAVARSGSSTKMFLNGAQQGSTYTDANAYVATEARIGIGITGTNPLSGFIDELRLLRGQAAWTAAFTAPTAAYADGLTTLFGAYAALLHFDAADASTTMTNGSGDMVFTANGNAQIDTAQFQFGTSSLLLDGTGDYIAGDGSEECEFGSADFQIDFWIRPATAGTQRTLYDGRPGAEGLYPRIYVKTDNKLYYAVNGTDRISGTSALVISTWVHVALVRRSGVTNLYLAGVAQGSPYTDANVYATGASRPIFGINGVTLNTEGWNGHIDEVRIIRGSTMWAANFEPPTRAAGTQATVGRNVAVSDALPLIFRFTPTDNTLVLQMSAGTEAAQIAVIYAGQLLVLERSVKVDAPHIDITHARQSSVLAGMSESGNFLGRVLLSSWRESKAEFAWFTPDWYRENFEPFVVSAVTEPFFWAWNPDEYPEETAFAWITEDVRPETDPATRRMAATISMRAIA